MQKHCFHFQVHLRTELLLAPGGDHPTVWPVAPFLGARMFHLYRETLLAVVEIAREQRDHHPIPHIHHLHPAPFNLHPTRSTPHPTPYTLNPTPYTPNLVDGFGSWCKGPHTA